MTGAGGARIEARGASALQEDQTILLHPQRYQPQTESGRYLLAHEAVHAVQRHLDAPQSPAAHTETMRIAAAEAEASALGRELALIRAALDGWWVSDGDVFTVMRILDTVGFPLAGAEPALPARGGWKNYEQDFAPRTGEWFADCDAGTTRRTSAARARSSTTKIRIQNSIAMPRSTRWRPRDEIFEHPSAHSSQRSPRGWPLLSQYRSGWSEAMKTQANSATHPQTQDGSVRNGIFQLKCGCGTHTPAGGKCANCSRASASANDLQRRATEPVPNRTASAVLRGEGRDFASVPVRNTSASDPSSALPIPLLAGLHKLSGMDLSEVRVERNSAEPAAIDAFAFTAGDRIALGPGQEHHLAHEAWHAVQQRQGRVRPTMQIEGVRINDDDGLEREADRMGEQAQAIGQQASGNPYQTMLANADGALPEELLYTTSLGQVQRRSVGNIGARAVVQRAATFTAGTVTATTNLASHLISGRRDAGFTPPTLNGSAILSAAAAIAAIRSPVLGGRSNADGTITTWVQSVPSNDASFTMQVPSSGPWSTPTTGANVNTLLTGLGMASPATCAAAAATTFSVNGKPTDAGFAAAVLTHENLHAADHKTGFNAVTVPWDTSLEAARSANTRFNGADLAAAEAALFKAMGGTPSAIATAQHNRWVALNNATHTGATVATGAAATPSNAVANATCTTASIDVS